MRLGFFQLLAVCVLGFSPALAPGAIIWNESTDGNFSADQTAPTPLSLTAGVNSIVGTVGTAANKQDWFTITIPQGDTLTSLVLADFVSTDSQGFMGFQDGSSFVGNSQTASPYAGYTHWGTAATNGAFPPANLVGHDLLPLMGNPAVAAGSQGFTSPLGAGSYTFLVQQSGALTSYQLDFGVTAVPEPAAVLMVSAGALLLCMKRKRRST